MHRNRMICTRSESKRKTVLAIIGKHCNDCSHTNTVEWTEYNFFEGYGYYQQVVVHKEIYIDPTTVPHTKRL